MVKGDSKLCSYLLKQYLKGILLKPLTWLDNWGVMSSLSVLEVTSCISFKEIILYDCSWLFFLSEIWTHTFSLIWDFKQMPNPLCKLSHGLNHSALYLKTKILNHSWFSTAHSCTGFHTQSNSSSPSFTFICGPKDNLFSNYIPVLICMVKHICLKYSQNVPTF